jgi:hypothetical protein
VARTTRIIDQQPITGSERIIGPFSIGKDLSGGELILDRTGFVDATARIHLLAEWSTDDWKTRHTWCGCAITGGVRDKAESGVSTATLPPRGASVRVRVRSNGKTVSQPIKLMEDALADRLR